MPKKHILKKQRVLMRANIVRAKDALRFIANEIARTRNKRLLKTLALYVGKLLHNSPLLFVPHIKYCDTFIEICEEHPELPLTYLNIR